MNLAAAPPRTVVPLILTALLLIGFAPLSASGQQSEKKTEAPDAGQSKSQESPPSPGKTNKPPKPPRGESLFDGKSLAGWKTAEKFSFEDHGKVSVEKGQLLLAMGKPATGVACTAKLPRDNYELSLEARRTDGGDFFCGLTFPVKDEHCSLIVGGWGGGVIGLSNVDNVSAIENDTTGYHPFKDNQWYRVRLRVTPEKIQAWIDDEEVIDLAREGRRFSIWWEQEPMRPLGVATWNTGAALRNIRFRDLDPKRAQRRAAEAKRDAQKNDAQKNDAQKK